MNPIKFAKRRPMTTLMLVVALVGGGVFGLYKMRVEIPGVNTPRVYASLDSAGTHAEQIKGRIVAQYEAYFHKEKAKEGEGEGEAHHAGHKVVVTSPLPKDVIITQDYVCQIHSQRHIEVRAFAKGYLEEILLREGQAVKKGDLMFKILPILYEAKLEGENAERDVAKMELNYSKDLAGKNYVSQNEVNLLKAKLARAQAKATLSKAEMDFTKVTAPFDGIVDRLREQQGSLVNEGDILTTLSDNSWMWVYFNVPEAEYLQYKADENQGKDSPDIELELADHHKFPQLGKIATIEARFNNETGTVPFRADFPNPKGLLRHGQTGRVKISRPLHDAILIPMRASFETLAKQYVFVVGKDDIVHQREIIIQHELEDVYVISRGLDVGDKIVLEGVRQVRDGDKVEYEFRRPEDVMKDQKNHAE